MEASTETAFTRHRNGLWGIFFFWLAVIIFCNLVTIYLHADKHVIIDAWQVGGLRRFLIGFFLQMPFLMVLTLLHYSIDLWLQSARGGWARLSQAVTTAVLSFTLVGIYTSSEITYGHLDSYLGLNALTPIFTDTKQIMLKSWHDASESMVVAAILSVLLGTIYLRWRHHTHPKLSNSLGSVHHYALPLLIILSMGVVWSMQSLAVNSSLSYQSRFHSYPTSYAVMSLFSHQKGLSDAGKNYSAESLQPSVSMSDYAAEVGDMANQPNVFIIMMESASFDHVGFNGYSRPDISPNLDALAKDSLVFTKAYSTSNHSNYAQTSIYSSQYALRQHSLDSFLNVDYPRVLVFDVLKSLGYQTALISSQNENWQGMKRFLTTPTKFDLFFHSVDALGENIEAETKLDDAYTREKAQIYLINRDPSQPQVLAVNFQRTHFPYHLPVKAERPYAPHDINFDFQFFGYPKDQVETVRNVYDNALRYVDTQIGELIATLKALGIYDESIIVVIPDHGEAFYENGYPSHGTSLYDDQVRTFALFKTPHSEHVGRRDDAISHVDVAPTILEILDLPNHPGFQGRGVLNTIYQKRNLFITSQGVIPAHGVVQHPWKYIQSKTKGVMLLNLDLNPQEDENMLQQWPEKGRELKAMLSHYSDQQLGYYQSTQRQTHYPPRYSSLNENVVIDSLVDEPQQD